MKNKEIQAKIAKKKRQIEKLEEQLKKIEVDFSILNDVDVFYANYESGNEYLFKGNAFKDTTQVLNLVDNSANKCSLYNVSVKTIRKATEEEIKLFNSKFAKYEVEISNSLIKEYRITKKGSNTGVYVMEDYKLAKDICEFLNNRL